MSERWEYGRPLELAEREAAFSLHESLRMIADLSKAAYALEAKGYELEEEIA